MTHSVLVVDSQPTHRELSARTLTALGYDVTPAATFDEAKHRLSVAPPLALLIADIRLGPYNGLHVALRAKSMYPRICIIITDGTYDVTLAREAREIGALYVVKPLPATKLAALVTGMLTGHTDRPSTSRRWRRINLTDPVRASVGPVTGRLIDMSYGGLRLKFPAGPWISAPAQMDVMFPDLRLTVAIQCVWERAADDSDGWLCGGELIDAENEPSDGWRRFVDSFAVA